MLQICSGKFFQSDKLRTNNLKGIIYTNLNLSGNVQICTKAGTITSIENITQPYTLLYQVEEKIESPEQGSAPALLISHTLYPYISDFCVLLSFALNCTASPSSTLVQRLLSNQRSILTQAIPNQVVSQVFDSNVNCTNLEEDFLAKFIEHIIGLKRSTYICIMRAIRTYVTAMHRIADDFELAYTLLVASIESLAQDFDGHQPTWKDYNQEKRKKIDLALINTDDLTVEKVRSTLLEIEHTSLGRRFRDFTLDNISQSYYREEAIRSLNPISKFDLPKALSFAYQARSQYIHQLKKLPKQLTTIFHYSETYVIDDKLWLSIQGLSRLARHVIIEFIFKQETINKEKYDYSSELFGIMYMPLAPEFWVGNPDLYHGSGSKRLEGFLQQLANTKTGSKDAKITDLQNVLEEVETKIYQSHLKKEDRLAYIALYIIYNYSVHKKHRMNGLNAFHLRFEKELLEPSPEGLITYYLFKVLPHWDIQTHHTCLLKYLKTRGNKFSFKAPKVFETGMILALAERYRISSNYGKASELISMAIENNPGNQELLQLEMDFKTNSQEIDWVNILLPTPKEQNEN